MAKQNTTQLPSNDLMYLFYFLVNLFCFHCFHIIGFFQQLRLIVVGVVCRVCVCIFNFSHSL